MRVYLQEMPIYMNSVSLMSRNDVSLTANSGWNQHSSPTGGEGQLHGCLGACSYKEVPALILRERCIAGKGNGGQGH